MHNDHVFLLVITQWELLLCMFQGKHMHVHVDDGYSSPTSQQNPSYILE